MKVLKFGGTSVADSKSINKVVTILNNNDDNLLIIVSAFGGVIAFNREVNEKLIKNILDNQFVELIVAPSFTNDSLEYAKTKKMFE